MEKKSYGSWFHLKETDSVGRVLEKLDKQIKQHTVILNNLKELQIEYLKRAIKELDDVLIESIEDPKRKELFKLVKNSEG